MSDLLDENEVGDEVEREGVGKEGAYPMLKSECSVCGSPAAAHLHYGAISCYSCRAFFRRGPPKQTRCIFGHGQCKITRYNRTNCKQCRYLRCIQVGMVPEKVDATVNKKRERESRAKEEAQQQQRQQQQQPHQQQNEQLGTNDLNRSPGSVVPTISKTETNENLVPKEEILEDDPVIEELEAAADANSRLSHPEVGGNTLSEYINRPGNMERDRGQKHEQSPKREPRTSSGPTVSPFGRLGLTSSRVEGWGEGPSSTLSPSQPDNYIGSAVKPEHQQFPVPNLHQHTLHPNLDRSNDAQMVEEGGSRWGQGSGRPVLKARDGSRTDTDLLKAELSRESINHNGYESRYCYPANRHIPQYQQGPRSYHEGEERTTYRPALKGYHHEVSGRNTHRAATDRTPYINYRGRNVYPNPVDRNGFRDTRNCYRNTMDRLGECESTNSSRSCYPGRMRLDPSSGFGIGGVPVQTTLEEERRRYQESYSRDIGQNSPGERPIQETSHIRWTQPHVTEELMRMSNVWPDRTTADSRVNGRIGNNISPELGMENFTHSLPALCQQSATPLYTSPQLLSNSYSHQPSYVQRGPNDDRSGGMSLFPRINTPGRGLAPTQQQHPPLSPCWQMDNIYTPRSPYLGESSYGPQIPSAQPIRNFSVIQRCEDPRRQADLMVPHQGDEAHSEHGANSTGSLLDDDYDVAKFSETNSSETFIGDTIDSLAENLSPGLEGGINELDYDIDLGDISRGLRPPEPKVQPSGTVVEFIKKRKWSEILGMNGEEEEASIDSYGLPVRDAGRSIPLKKQARMYLLAYPIGHAVNKAALPVLPFTLEEEFSVMDYVVRIEEYQNRRFDFLFRNFNRYKDLLVSYIQFTKMGLKVPYSKTVEKTLLNLSMEFTKTHTNTIFNEMNCLTTEVKRTVLNSTYPSLYVVFFSIMEGNTRESTWKKQHEKTLYITEENHAALRDHLEKNLTGKSISIKDQERFTTPWACKLQDEIKFEKIVSIIGRLLRDDMQLQALYHMLIMLTPSQNTPTFVQNDPKLKATQLKISKLIYRYLSTAPSAKVEPVDNSGESSIMKLTEDMGYLSPSEKTGILLSMVEQVHDCGDIMQNRSLPGQNELPSINSYSIVP